MFTERALLGAADADSIDALWARAAARAVFPRHRRDRRIVDRRVSGALSRSARTTSVAAAERVLRHEFDLLGSGRRRLGRGCRGTSDFKTGREWPLAVCPDIEYSELDRPSDVKVPWELSRCQHFPLLGQAYWLTGDERYAREFVAEVDDWIARNPFGHGVNWACAMDVALRAVSWIWGFYFMAGSAACADAGVSRPVPAQPLPARRVRRHASRDGGPSTAITISATASAWCSSARSFARTARGREWLALGDRIVVDEMLDADHGRWRRLRSVHRLSPPRARSCFSPRFLLLDMHGEPSRPRAGSGSSACSSSWRRTRSRTAARRSSAMPTMAGCRSSARSRSTTIATCCRRARRCFGRGDFKSWRRQFWEESFWLLGPDAQRGLRRSRDGQRAGVQLAAFPDGGFFVLRDRTRTRSSTAATSGCAAAAATATTTSSSFELCHGRAQPRHRLRRLRVHRLARLAESVPQHGVPQHRAGGWRGDQSLRRVPMPLAACDDDATPDGVRWSSRRLARSISRRASRVSATAVPACRTPDARLRSRRDQALACCSRYPRRGGHARRRVALPPRSAVCRVDAGDDALSPGTGRQDRWLLPGRDSTG